MQKLLFFLFCFSLPFYTFSQTDTNYVLNFNFNGHQIKEADNKLIIKPVGVSLTDDRFGNKESAIYLHGDAMSYLNLGTSSLLKPKKGTISLWVNLDRRVYTGKGYEDNPIIETKNDTGYDFNCAYVMTYDCYSKRFRACATKDSTKESDIKSIEEARFGKWYHLVITYDTNYLSFYVNGKLQQRTVKGFETKFLLTDSVVVGNSASIKNYRWAEGIFDDIQIFHRVLNDNEIKELYKAPNPNRVRLILDNILLYTGIGLLVFLVAYFLVASRRRSLKREEEKFKLKSKLYEMEIKMIKSQMNPHFLFNSLNSIQQLVALGEKDKAEYYLSKFSRLVRKLLENTTKDTLSLADEIDILNRFLEIESLRFNHVFKYNIVVDNDINTSTTFIPHFLIQPFVENAIWHGLLPKQGEKNLSIHFQQISKEKIACVIEDNGVGRNDKKQNFEKKSLAISFIQQRLDLMNENLGTNLSLQIIDKTDKDGNSEGTRVVLNLPIIKSKNTYE